MTGSWGPLGGCEFGEPEAGLQVLRGLRSSHSGLSLLDSLNDMDGFSSGRVSSSHLTVHLGNGVAEAVASVLLVHVDDTSSSEVLKHDSVVLDRVCFSFEDLAHGHNLALALSYLVLSLHLIPESSSSNHTILSKHADSEAGWVGVLIGWELSAHYPPLLDL